MTAECHDLASDANGNVRFAFTGKDPWHQLGTAVSPDDDLDTMMEQSRTNYTVQTRGLIAVGDDGEPLRNADGSYVYFDTKRGTVGTDPDGTMFGLATVGLQYQVAQNRHNVEKGLTIVEAGLDKGVHIATLGAMDDGRKFFVSIDLGDAVVFERDGVADTVKRYLGIYSSHDGSVPSTFDLSGIRRVCRNTVNASLASASAKFKARHTKNGVDFSVEEARQILGLSEAWVEGVRQNAEKMGNIPVTQAEFDAVFFSMFPAPADAQKQKRAAENNDKLYMEMNAIYKNDRNAGSFGENGWSLYNAFTEYFDHHRDGTADERATTSMTLGSWVYKAKDKAQERILALV